MKIHLTLLALALAGCSTVKPMGGAVVGAGAGTLIGGPVGGAVGAAVGAGGGAVWQEMSAIATERDECKEEQVRLHAALEDLRATLKANAQIDAYNLTATRKVPHTNPEDTSDAPRWFSIAWKALLVLLGAGSVYIFRHPLRTWLAQWWLRLSDALRGRAPSVPKPTPAPEPTPLNPEP